MMDAPLIPDPNDIRAVVADQLRAARKLRGLGLRQAAARLGVSPSFLSQMEKEQRNVSLEFLFKASSIYRVSVDVLLGRDPLPGSSKGQQLFDLLARFFRPAEGT